MDEQLFIFRYFVEMFADNGKVRYRFFDDSGRARGYVERIAGRRVAIAADNPATWWVVGAYLHEITGRGVPRVIDYFNGGDQGDGTAPGWESLGPGFAGKVSERPHFA
jgi:hypothetical protein